MSKLKRLMNTLRDINKEKFSNIELQFEDARRKLEVLQSRIHISPLNEQLLEEEKLLSQELRVVQKA